MGVADSVPPITVLKRRHTRTVPAVTTTLTNGNMWIGSFSGEDEGPAARLTVDPGFLKASRWIVEPHGEQRLLLKCFADDEGAIACTLHFCIVGDPQTFRLDARATCTLPKLANFPEGCFEHAIQQRNAQHGLRKTYVSNEVNCSMLAMLYRSNGLRA